jgi:predicted O-methyltransferase YrrM
MDITNPDIEGFIRGLLARYDEPVLLEMEEEGRQRGFPIIGRMVGVAIEILARSIGARRVFELGSGYGYSAYWFLRAVGPEGEVHLTDGDPENERKAMDYLKRAGLDRPVRFHVGDAVEALNATEGQFDVVYCDIDKEGYPPAWRASRDRIRVGGMFICDNALGFGPGKVIEKKDGRIEQSLAAIREMDASVAADPDFISTILPIRDGDLVALRIR